MADLAATDVTVTMIRKDMTRRTRMNIVDVSFGNGALTVPAAGIPLPVISKFGCPSQIDVMLVEQKADGYVYKYDRTNHKLMVKQTATLTPTGTVAAPVFTGSALATHTHNMTFIGGITATEPVAIDGGDILGKNAATNRTILGADVATKGGVVAITGGTPAGTNSAPAFTGAATTAAALGAYVGAPAAMTLRVVVFGK